MAESEPPDSTRDTADAEPSGGSGGGLSSSGRRAVLLCLAILLILEFGAARRDWLWKLDPRRPVGILLAVEEQLIEPVDEPRVVILGSSVVRDAILPRLFEQVAGLPRGSVLNTSLPNATPFDFVLLYERNRQRLARSRLLIVGVEEWYFYEEPGIPERYHRWATLQQRFADYEGSQRLPLLVSWVWKTYAARNVLSFEAATGAADVAVIGNDGRTRWRAEEQATGSADFDLSAYEARLHERQWRDRQTTYLQQLVGLAAADGLPLLIVRMPLRAAAQATRGRLDPGAEERLQEALATAGDAARLLDLPAAPDAGLQEQHFLDERHLGTTGAEVFTRFLADWTVQQGLLDAPFAVDFPRLGPGALPLRVTASRHPGRRDPLIGGLIRGYRNEHSAVPQPTVEPTR